MKRTVEFVALIVMVISNSSGVDILQSGEEPYTGVLTLDISEQPKLTLETYKCCLMIEDSSGSVECQLAKLLLVPYQPSHLTEEKVKVLFLLPNKYPINRFGECELHLNVNGVHIEHKIQIRKNASLATPCQSLDEDYLDNCSPVDCFLKYGGLRNYFDNSTRRCEKVPVCATEAHGDSDKVYDPETNTCVDADKVVLITEEDREFFRSQKITFPKERKSPIAYPFICVHGRRIESERSCLCDFGWASDSFEKSLKNNISYLCNKGIIEHVMGKDKKEPIILITLGAIGAVLIVMIVHCVKMKKEDFDKVSSLNTSDDTFSDDEVLNDEHKQFFRCARVHTPNYPLEDGELNLKIGDIVNDLAATDTPGTWLGTCKEVRGTFPAGCAQVYLPGERIPCKEW